MFLFYFLLLTAEFSHCLSLKEIVNSLPPLPFLSCFFVSFFLHGNEMKHFKILKWSSRCFAKLGSKWSLKARWNWEGTFSKWRKKYMCACKWKFRVRSQALEKDPFFLLCILCMGIFCKKSQILCLVCVWQWGNKWAGLDLWHCWKVERRWSCSAPCTSPGRKRWGGSASSIRQIKAISFWGAKSSFNESHPADCYGNTAGSSSGHVPLVATWTWCWSHEVGSDQVNAVTSLPMTREDSHVACGPDYTFCMFFGA